MSYLPGQTAPRLKARRRIALMKWARQFLAAIMAAALVSIGLLNNAQGNNCALDPSFGKGGKASTDFGGQELAYAGALQPDGKIIAVGQIINSSGFDFGLARYNPDGTLDNTFGGDGKVTTDFFGGSELAYGVAIQADNKIVVAGSIGVGSSQDNFALARYNSDGSLDDGTASDSTPADSFGQGGLVTTDFNGSHDIPNDIAIQPTDGKIVVVGSTRTSIHAFTDIAVARYHSNGALDTTFGNGGKLALDFHGLPDEASSVAIQPTDGKIVVAGAASITAPFRTDSVVVRLQIDGSPDPTFGNAGIVTTDFSGRDDGIGDIAIQPDGKIVTVGLAQLRGPAGLTLARYNSNGSLDNTFASGGKLLTHFRGGPYGNIATGVALQPNNGKIVVSGIIVRAQTVRWGDNAAFLVARYNTDGSLDTSFDGDGRTATDFYRALDEAGDVLVQPDGNIVAIGYLTTPDDNADFALARYLGDAADYTPRLDSLTLDTRILLGGSNLEGKVSLCGPAPAGGLKVTLADTLDATTVPRAVTIPAGETSATFTMRTKSVSETQTGHVFARLGPTYRTVWLVLKPIGIASLKLEPNPVEGPHQVRGTAVLNRPVPEGGTTLWLSSKNSAIAAPTVNSIFLPAGTRRMDFTVETSDVSSPRTAIITATINGTSKSVVLEIN